MVHIVLHGVHSCNILHSVYILRALFAEDLLHSKILWDDLWLHAWLTQQLFYSAVHPVHGTY